MYNGADGEGIQRKLGHQRRCRSLDMIEYYLDIASANALLIFMTVNNDS